MEIVKPEPFTFEGGEKAVLLLHGFTGNSADVRMLGRFLESKGYTCHGPQYKGHGGESPDELANSTPSDWWQSVLTGYQHLVNMGFKKIAVTGISLGGVMSLKLAMEKPVVAVIPMCAPMGFVRDSVLNEMVRSYAESYKKFEGKTDEQISQELNMLTKQPIPAVQGLLDLVAEVKQNLQNVEAPIQIIQGRKDNVIDLQSPDIIFNHVHSSEKSIKWYEQSGHIITLENERNKIEEDIYQFLESLNWNEQSNLLFDVKETEAPQIWW
ncbi:alpha/beta hydrolase [Neobacillus sp. D3-1R]|uniref:alpha/beta hydrolase n=1 Tax=Neobacillus sp. D3-1R TaxID=3445778 RepID=UPI003FA0E2CF